MRHLRSLALLSFLSLAIFSCKNNDPEPEPDGPTGAANIDKYAVKNASDASAGWDIKGNVTLSADTIWTLQGYVYVTNGATLTIEPGTIIKGVKGQAGAPANADKPGTIIVEKGGKLIANGTAEKPIVFTSSKPAGQRNYGDWGGVVLIGKAKTNQPPSNPFEGAIRGSYGSDNVADDNSGSLKYVRIEFAGTALSNASNSEINGLTLYGVGSGTTLEHIQISYSGDDSFEWFGGSVNAKYLVAHRGWDDDFDTDNGWSGKVQFAVSLRDTSVADASSSNAFESDSDANTTGTEPFTTGIFANVSVFAANAAPRNTNTSKGSGRYQAAMHLRRQTSLSVFNTVVVGYPQGLRLDDTRTLANATANNLQLRGVVFSNMTTPVLGAGPSSDATKVVTNDQAITFFDQTDSKNQKSVALADLLLNTANFTLTAPNFLVQATSPLLKDAVWTGKGSDAFFTKTAYRGAFDSSTDWTKGWTNFDPQNTAYEIVK